MSDRSCSVECGSDAAGKVRRGTASVWPSGWPTARRRWFTGVMNTGMDPICDDLEAETQALLDVVSGLAPAGWDAPTPAAGWSIRDQVSHLTYFDITGTLAASDPDAFAAAAKNLMTSGAGTDAGLDDGRAMQPDEVQASFVRARQNMISVFRTLDPKARLPWYGPAMGALSFATARLMETWAHGQDVCDAVGATRTPSARLKHVAHIGVRARPFSYAINKLPVPESDVAVILTAPDGTVWEWNIEAAGANLISGPALDFCLLVTQRRHVADTALAVQGPLAAEWVPIAQAFAGDPGPGRTASGTVS
jgi:uncharacterized protein (TIGR03084 family)